MKEVRTTSEEDFIAVSGIDLHLEVRGSAVRAGLTDALRDAVRSGRLAPGSRLPASRTLAIDLGVARSTVTQSYADLIAEGWLVAHHGSGTRVANRTHATTVDRAARHTPRPPQQAMHGMEPGAAAWAEFPRAQWLAAAKRALAAAPYDAFGYGDPLGRPELRVALAEYLSRARGVYAEPDRIMISSGFHHGLTLLARTLKVHGTDAVAVESYGLDLYREVLAESGLGIPALPVDERGARTEELDRLDDIGAVLLTPAHQFPTGVALSPARRAAVLDWAHSTGGLVLEDDYDGEFRYDRKPIGALQGLDPERIVYLGTASKSLAPALRLAWMVLPQRLVAQVAHAKGPVDLASTLEQLTLAEFISSGAFDRHLRSVRQRYRRRRDQLVAAVAASSPEVRVTGIAAGLQVVLRLPEGSGPSVLQASRRRGLIVSTMAEFRHEDAPAAHSSDEDTLVVNFAAVSDSAWGSALEGLCRTLRA
jgi:GntR family transcriptional regulator/MocR family aminotransferase